MHEADRVTDWQTERTKENQTRNREMDDRECNSESESDSRQNEYTTSVNHRFLVIKLKSNRYFGYTFNEVSLQEMIYRQRSGGEEERAERRGDLYSSNLRLFWLRRCTAQHSIFPPRKYFISQKQCTQYKFGDVNTSNRRNFFGQISES